MHLAQRRRFLAAASVLLASPFAGKAQETRRPPTIGMLLPGATPQAGQSNSLRDTFLDALRALGYAEGQNVIVEYRWSEGRNERFPALAEDLVRIKVRVIVAWSTPAALAAKAASSSIPIVIAGVGDPVGTGIVASLARPGGNITGLSLLDQDLDGKRLQLLKEAVPGLTRIGILWSPNDIGMTLAFSRVEAASHNLGLPLQSLAVRESGALADAFRAASAAGTEALIVQAQAFTNLYRTQIVELAAIHKLPAMYTVRSFVDSGGLMSYGPSLSDQLRRATGYVDKILRGAKPADLPVEQPTKFELVVNLNAAKALRVKIPQSILLRADRVIE